MPADLDAVTRMLQAEVDATDEPIEAFREFERITEDTDSKSKANEGINNFDRRRSLLLRVIQDILVLKQDDYPDLPRPVIDQKVFLDLQTRISTLSSVRQFVTTPVEASKVELAASTPSRK